MSLPDLRPRWMREVERLAPYKTQIYLYGNIKDTTLYPYAPEQEKWTLGPMREALFEMLRNRLRGYQVIASYNFVDGMSFADAADANEMVRTYNDLVAVVEKEMTKKPEGRAPQPVKSENPIDFALQQIRLCMVNKVYPCAFVVEHASRLVREPMHQDLVERTAMLRLLQSSMESQQVAVQEGENRRVLQNLLILLCDKLTDIPTWLYLNNPFVGSVEVEFPRSYERKHFFDLFLTPPKKEGEPQPEMPYAIGDLVDLTDGMTYRDLVGLRGLARRPENGQLNAKSLVDYYKYGTRETEWDSLDMKRLETAEEALEQRVIGQPAAVIAVADMVRRARLHLSGAQQSSRTRPRGVLFFAGPTGVGKTEMAKALAELIFTSEEACFRFDMSEYGLQHSDQRLLGAPPGYIGYEEGGQLTNVVRANPFSVLLFDEIEKAHPSILDKFLQILDDGRMTDGKGETVYFSESIIIFTSNVGIYQLDQATGRPIISPLTGKPLLTVDPEKDIRYEDVRGKIIEGVQSYFKHFLGRPELLNRIGQNIIVFDFIRPLVMRQIMERKVLKSIEAQVRERWNLNVQFTPEAIDQLMALHGSDVSTGGRGMGNLAEIAVLNPLARVIFERLTEEQELDGATLTVTGIIPPSADNNFRNDLTWELQEAPKVEKPEESEEESLDNIDMESVILRGE